MSVTVVIPTLNEEGYLGLLLTDLSRQTRSPDEVIVVDARSRDATVGMARGFPGVRVLESPVESVAAQRNQGAREAVGDVVIFMDADVRLPEAFLERFLAEFEGRRLDLACPYYASVTSRPLVRLLDRCANALFRRLEDTRWAFAPGGVLAVRRSALARGGLFGERLSFAEDAELVRRLSREHRFRTTAQHIYASDRRYRQEGMARMLVAYAVLLAAILTGRFDLPDTPLVKRLWAYGG